jgi:hypothetical protein
MKHNLYNRILAMTDAELDDYAKERKLDIPEEFCCSHPTKSKAEYIANALGIEDPDADDEDPDDDDLTGMQGSAIDKACQEILEEKKGMSYADALALARKQYPGLDRKYRSQLPGGGKRRH